MSSRAQTAVTLSALCCFDDLVNVIMEVKTSAAAIDVTFVHVSGQRADILFIFNKVVLSEKQLLCWMLKSLQEVLLFLLLLTAVIKV